MPPIVSSFPVPKQPHLSLLAPSSRGPQNVTTAVLQHLCFSSCCRPPCSWKVPPRTGHCPAPLSNPSWGQAQGNTSVIDSAHSSRPKAQTSAQRACQTRDSLSKKIQRGMFSFQEASSLGCEFLEGVHTTDLTRHRYPAKGSGQIRRRCSGALPARGLHGAAGVH